MGGIMKVSVIVPVYNVENYLEQCLSSIVRQSYKDLEIILVDDGSIDDSSAICDRYAIKDKRIRVIHKQNGGLMSAWKTGLNLSTGNYIGFVDSDDWIDDNMYECLIENALRHNADIVVCQLIQENKKQNSHTKESLCLQPGIYDKYRIKNELISGIINDGRFLGRKLSPNRVTKLFKREILEQNKYLFDHKISFGEDLITSFACVLDATKIVIMEDFFPYHYRYNNQSITRKYDQKLIDKINLLNNKLQEIANKKGIKINEQIANDYISLALLCIESEILYSPFPFKYKIEKIKRICKSDLFVSSLKNGMIHKFSIKYKFFLFLIKKNMYISLYLVRKIIIYLNTKNLVR
jgi:glycosyltransferase involved in cell wall biosynthesis